MSSKIPYARQSINRQDVKAVADALKDDYLTQGPMVERFEKAVAGYCGARFAVAVNSGTSALHIACLAAEIKPGDEGITSPITFVASSNCMLYCGAQPVFADIDSDTICIDPEEIEKKITAKTKIIIPVHFAGHPCDMERIHKIAKNKKLTVIEDACHALGATYKGSKIGSCEYSDMTVMSFHAVKHITTGEGGMVLTNNQELYEKLKVLRSHGITREKGRLKNDPGGWYYEMQYLGFNYRITDFQCALGMSQLKRLDQFIKRRREIARQYDKVFNKSDLICSINQESNGQSSYHLYVVRFNLEKLRSSKRAIFDEFRKQGIMVNLHYIPVYQQPYYRDLGYGKVNCPKAEKYYQEALTLPLYPGMTDKDVKKVIKVTRTIYEK